LKDKDPQEVVVSVGKSRYAAVMVTAHKGWDFVKDKDGKDVLNEKKMPVTKPRLDRSYRVEFTTGDKMPEISDYGFAPGKYTITSDLTSPANLMAAVARVAGRAEERVKASVESAAKADQEVAAYSKKLETTKFDKADELAEKRDKLDELQSALMGGAQTRSAAAQQRAAKRKGLLFDEPAKPVPIEVEREQIRRELAALDNPEPSDEQKQQIAEQRAIIKRGETYLADPDPDLGDHHLDAHRSNIKNANERIEKIRKANQKEADEKTKTLRERLAEIEAKMLTWLDAAIKATELAGGKLMEGVTGAPVWLTKAAAHGALKMIRLGVKAGMSLADSIAEALSWMKQQQPGDFQVAEARTWLEKVAGGKPDEKPERERSMPEIKTDLADAESELKRFTGSASTFAGGRAAHQQAMFKAAATYRNMRDELLHHPDYVAEQLARQNAAIQDANALLKPLGMAAHPEEVLDWEKLSKTFTPTQVQRLQDWSAEIEAAHDELRRMPAKLVSRVYAEMQKDGRLPNSTPIPVNAGRSLDHVTDWLRKQGV
ncbi:MAG: hypothetical protein WCS42_28035, partial [Verrucomicrobiota bacterium]